MQNQNVRLALTFLTLLSLSEYSGATMEGAVRLGVQAGQVGLLSDVGSFSGSSNNLGAGVLVGYSATDDMVFEIGYLSSNHSNVAHQEVNLGLDYYLGSYNALYPQLIAGASFIGNTLTDTSPSGNNAKVGSNAFGLYFGGGVDFELGQHMAMGLQAMYTKAFESTVVLPSGPSVKGVQDSFTVLLRLMYQFGGTSWKDR